MFVIYMYIASGCGQTDTWGPNVFRIIHLPISCKFFPKNDILTVFPIQMQWRPMLTLGQGHPPWVKIYKHIVVPDASCQFSLKSIQWFRRRRFLNGFQHIWAWRHVTWIIYKHIGFPFVSMIYVKFGFDWPGGFREEELENGGRQTDGWTPVHGHPISSLCEPNGSSELKMLNLIYYGKDMP